MPDENVAAVENTPVADSSASQAFTPDPPARNFDDVMTISDADWDRFEQAAEAKPETPSEAVTPEATPTEVKTQTPAEAVALAPVVEPEAPAAAHSRFAPLFETYENDNVAVDAFAKTLDDIAAYDPVVNVRLLNAMYNKHEQTYKAWAFQEAGLDQRDIDQYKAWKASGADLPQAQVFQAPQFPTPDQFGIVTMPDGVQLDISETGDPRDKMLYNLQKSEHDRGVVQQKADFERQQNEQRTMLEQQRTAKEQAERKQYETIQAREQEFAGSLIETMNHAIASCNVSYDPTAKFLENALKLDIQNAIFSNPEVIKLADAATEIVHQGGARAKDFAFEIGKIIRQTVKEKVESYNAFVTGRARAVAAATIGKPNLEAVKTIQAPAPTAQPVQRDPNRPRTINDIERELMSRIAERFPE